MINSLRVEAYRQIDLERQTIRERPPEIPYGRGTDNPGQTGGRCVSSQVPPVPQRTTRVINKLSFFKSEKMLESEADIEEYLTQLKGKLVTILKEENIRI